MHGWTLGRSTQSIIMFNYDTPQIMMNKNFIGERIDSVLFVRFGSAVFQLVLKKAGAILCACANQKAILEILMLWISQ